MMIDFLTPKRLPLLIAATAALVLAGANFFEHVLGYAPCQLCLYQRLPWWIALGLGSLAMVFINKRPTLALLVMIVALIAVLAGAGIAGYHAGVEYKFWAGPASCTSSGQISEGLAAAIAKTQAGKGPPLCDEIPWSLFGISMAGYNFLLSLGLVGLGIAILRKAGRTPR